MLGHHQFTAFGHGLEESHVLFQDDGLTGPIPPELGGLSNLWDLQLYRANFTGSIPGELGNLDRLERLWLLDNSLTGTIPLEILEIEPLRDLLVDHLLKDLLIESAPARIVNVASVAHRISRINFDDLHMTHRYWGMTAYGQSKLANVLFTYELAHRLIDTGGQLAKFNKRFQGLGLKTE